MTYLWFGLFDVVPNAENPDVLDGAKGAFVNVIGLAQSRVEFFQLVEAGVNDLGLEVSACEEIDVLTTTQSRRDELSEELIEMAARLTEKSPIAFDEFQAYMED